MNKVCLIGRTCKDVVVRKVMTQKGEMCVSNFVLALNDGYGENKKSIFIPCRVFNNNATNMEKYCGKGSLVCIEGKLSSYNYVDKQGVEKSGLEVVVERIEYCDIKQPNRVDEQTILAQNYYSPKEQPKEVKKEIIDNGMPF